MTAEADPAPTEAETVSHVLHAEEGETAALMRAVDWSATPLGPERTWPQSLRTTLSICLLSRFPLLLWWGPELVMLYNDSYAPLIGSKHPQALGTPGRLVFQEIWDTIGPMLERVRTTGQATLSRDLGLMLARGGYLEETYFTFSYSPILDESGNVGGIFTAVLETTESVIGARRLETLRQLADRSRILTEQDAWRSAADVLSRNSRDVCFAALYRVSEPGRAVELTAVTGMPGEHPLCNIGVLTDTDCPVATRIAECITTGKPVTLENARAVIPDLKSGPWGDPPEEVVLYPLLQPGQETAMGVMVAGVSAHRRLDDSYRTFFSLAAGQVSKSIADARALEEERRRAEKLAELDRAKTNFFSNVSHEFRTPLTLMLGPLEELVERRGQPLVPQDWEQIELVRRNALRLHKLVNALLEFSRMETRRTQAAFQPTDLSASTADLASIFRHATEKAGLALRLDCPPLSEPIFVDRAMWETVVLNLLSNALKFTFEGEISVTLREQSETVSLTVADTGIGIDASELPHIFERFHRVEDARGRSIEGSGIGLALAKELVQLHGGTITAESTPGRGSSFVVTLRKGTNHIDPALRAVDPISLHETGVDAYLNEALGWLEPEAQPYTEVANSGPTLVTRVKKPMVLVADDNADMRRYLQRILSEHWEVITAPNGEEALDCVRQHRPELVISDVMMPRLDGLGLLREIRNDPEIASTPVILLSAQAGDDARSEGLYAGANDYLVKPFWAREVVARISAQISLRRMRQQAEQMEEKLRGEAEEQRQRLWDLFMNAPAGIMITEGPEHRIVLINETLVRVLGKSNAGDYLGKRLVDAIPEIAEQKFPAILDRVYREGTPHVEFQAEVKLNRARAGQPETGYFNYVYQPSRDIHGEVQGILIHAVEVTEIVTARQEAERRQELIELAQRAANAGSYFWYPKAGMMQWTRDLYEIYGLPQDAEPSIELWASYLHPEDRPGALSRLRELLDRREADYRQEFRVMRGDGETRWVVSYGRMSYDAEGQPERMVGINMDITQRRRTEEALRQTEKLAAVGRLAASIAHEINNPLEAVTNLLYLVEHQPELDSTARRYVEAAQQQLARVSAITTQTLRFHRQSTLATRVDVAEILHSIFMLFRGRLVQAQIELRRDFSFCEPILCFEGEVRQVLMNLVSNAIDAIAPLGSGVLAVRVRMLERGGRRRLVITIADNGTGMEPAVQRRIFEPFFTTKGITGTGLGLWISSDLVEKHGGTLRMRSSRAGRRRGTTFQVTLPYQPRR